MPSHVSMAWDKTIANFCFKQIFSNICQYFVAIVCYKTPKNCLSLAYATDLDCHCYYSSVLYCTSIGGTSSQCNKYCTHVDVTAHRTIFVKLWKQLILQTFSILTFVTKCSVAIKQNQLEVQKMHRNNPSFNQGNLIFKVFRGKLPIPLCTPQGCCYRDQIVFRLLYSLFLLLFFNLKTLKIPVHTGPSNAGIESVWYLGENQMLTGIKQA